MYYTHEHIHMYNSIYLDSYNYAYLMRGMDTCINIQFIHQNSSSFYIPFLSSVLHIGDWAAEHVTAFAHEEDVQ